MDTPFSSSPSASASHRRQLFWASVYLMSPLLGVVGCTIGAIATVVASRSKQDVTNLTYQVEKNDSRLQSLTGTDERFISLEREISSLEASRKSAENADAARDSSLEQFKASTIEAISSLRAAIAANRSSGTPGVAAEQVVNPRLRSLLSAGALGAEWMYIGCEINDDTVVIQLRAVAEADSTYLLDCMDARSKAVFTDSNSLYADTVRYAGATDRFPKIKLSRGQAERIDIVFSNRLKLKPPVSLASLQLYVNREDDAQNSYTQVMLKPD
jgi:hypothetical protein